MRFALALLLGMVATGAEARCLRLDAPVQLAGRLERHGFAPPPGSDRAAPTWLLRLDRPRCIAGQVGINFVQLAAAPERLRAAVAGKAGQEVRYSGRLYAGDMGLHHAPMVLLVGAR